MDQVAHDSLSLHGDGVGMDMQEGDDIAAWTILHDAQFNDEGNALVSAGVSFTTVEGRRCLKIPQDAPNATVARGSILLDAPGEDVVWAKYITYFASTLVRGTALSTALAAAIKNSEAINDATYIFTRIGRTGLPQCLYGDDGSSTSVRVNVDLEDLAGQTFSFIVRAARTNLKLWANGTKFYDGDLYFTDAYRSLAHNMTFGRATDADPTNNWMAIKMFEHVLGSVNDAPYTGLAA